MNKNIIELSNEIKENSKIIDDLFNETKKECVNYNKEYNALVTIVDEIDYKKNEKSLLNGIPFAAKDNFSTKGILSTGSSNTLKDYIPFYTATCIKNLQENGAVLVGKTAMDEFGLGGSGITCHTGCVHNPWDFERSCGGSSSGSASLVAAGIVPFAIGSDTGDSIRKPAAYSGIVGYKPTYGMISRYGLFQYASSLDTCGVLTRNVRDAAIVVDAMKGLDKHDLTTWDSSNINLYKDLTSNLDGKKFFYIKELINEENYSKITTDLRKNLEAYHKTLDLLKNNGAIIEEVSIDKEIIDALPCIYISLSRAEATSNLSNLTGIVFGPRGNGNNYIEMMKDYRSNNFSPLLKRRLVIGSYMLQKENQEKYFVNAQRLRRKIVDIIDEYFKKYDALIMPVGLGKAPLLKDCHDNLSFNEYTSLDENLQIANYGGYPSITIPNGFIDDCPIGINITGKCFDDQNVLNIAYGLEKLLPYSDQIADWRNK